MKEEVETLFEEQLMFMEWPDRLKYQRLRWGLPRETGDMLARAIRTQVGVKSRVMTITEQAKAVNYDALFLCRYSTSGSFRSDADSGLVLPVVYSLDCRLAHRHHRPLGRAE